MSKKKFHDGLDDILRDSSDLPMQGGPGSQERKPVGKNFLTDLDSLFREAMDETINRQTPTSPQSPTGKSANQQATRPALSGLDSLIRQTIRIEEINEEDENGKKRLTVAVDRQKLEQLKIIARLENSYLKDLLVNLINEYIDEYRKNKGVDI
jgi:hypothetical protein